MVYLDSSVLLTQLRVEEVSPPVELWQESLVSSRLLEYETLTRIHAKGGTVVYGELAKELLRRVAILELVEPVVGRATEPFPVPLRTLDALHLASMLFLREQGVDVRLATYDRRLRKASEALGFRSYPLGVP